MKNILLIISMILILPAFSQVTTISGTLTWGNEINIQSSPTGKPYQVWPCKDCIFSDKYPGWPIKSITLDLASNGELKARIVSSKWEVFPTKEVIDENKIPTTLGLQTSVSIGVRKAIGNISFPVLRKIGSNWEKLVTYTIEYTLIPSPMPQSRGTWTYNSVLEKGESYKIAIEKDDVYKLDYNYFKNTLGIDPANINPKQIKIYGNGGGMLPKVNLPDVTDDLKENAIYFKGEEDGKFDQGDYILMYAESANKTNYLSTSNKLSVETNLYSNKNYYFIQINGGDGKRISTSSTNVQPGYWSQTFQEVIRFEEEKYNLLDVFEYTQGSGSKWFGETYGPNTEKTYTDKFHFENIVTSENVNLVAEFSGRSAASSKFTMNIQGASLSTKNINPADFDVIDSQYAAPGSINYSFLPIQGNIPITAKYIAGSNSTGWLDYIEIMATRSLKLTGNSMIFQDLKTLNAIDEGYIVEGVNSDAFIWNITENDNILNESYILEGGSKAKFTRSSETLEKFVVLNPTASFPSPEFDKKIAAQNLHSIDNVDMVIIYHSDFEESVQKLKDHRSAYSNFEIATVRVDQLFNEFSSGRQDISAMRDFARMLYERNERFKYLMFFGDGTFDYKNNLNNDPHKNYVPIYETDESMEAIYAYPSDDYFALLDVGEPVGTLQGSLDIAIGRATVNTPEEAETAVEKIIHYDNPPETLKDWRNWLVFVADDDDGTFEVESDYQSKLIESRYPVWNHDKVYMDAFKKESTPGGDRFPDATTAINNNIYKGCLIINYQGHGGPKGWAQERVLSNTDILEWENYDKLTLLITATCSFAGYDDPSVETGGELAFRDKSGAVALFSTVRPVYNSANAAMVMNVYDTIFTRQNGKLIPMGEVLRIAKNWASGPFETHNARKFTMIGDPSQNLAIPQYSVKTFTINGKPVDGNSLDTLKALQKVTITGAVTDINNNVLSDFNGKLYTTVFDKKKDYKTLGQTGDVVSFTLQKSVLFKGTASVTNGLFSFTFVIPKDINYVLGSGKISYYAENSKIDAHGYYKGIVIGGSDTTASDQDDPPVVKVYMNDENFKSGGLTKNNPTLVAVISDDLGINITGTSIGHDLTAILDENTENQIILNDFFEASLNDYTQGKVKYPLSKLSVGKHTLKVKAWDISNNSGEGFTEFVIAEDGNTALQNVLSYPNPFINSTKFQFEHNLSNNNLHVRIRIYSINGQLVKTIDQDVMSDGSRITGIEWDGRNDSGNEIGKGVYIYNIVLSGKEGTGSTEIVESSFEKLVLLK